MSFWKRFKSSITGLFVKPEYAAANPETTFAQRVPAKKMKSADVGTGAVKKAKQSRVARKAAKVKPKSKR